MLQLLAGTTKQSFQSNRVPRVVRTCCSQLVGSKSTLKVSGGAGMIKAGCGMADTSLRRLFLNLDQNCSRRGSGGDSSGLPLGGVGAAVEVKLGASNAAATELDDGAPPFAIVATAAAATPGEEMAKPAMWVSRVAIVPGETASTYEAGVSMIVHVGVF